MKRQRIRYFSTFELLLWLSSLFLIVLSFVLFDRESYMTLAASLIGATALIFTAKGHVLGQILIVVFSGFYGYISYTFAYYGEMVTYLGMSAPIAIAAVFSWIRNPSDKKTEVKVNRLSTKELLLLVMGGIAVTVGFYFILSALGTASLLMSTVSVLTSFIAAYLTMRRSEYYALAYALNDAVLIVLWIIATMQNIGYLSVVICFVVFLVNDVYGFLNWARMKRRQHNTPVPNPILSPDPIETQIADTVGTER